MSSANVGGTRPTGTDRGRVARVVGGSITVALAIILAVAGCAAGGEPASTATVTIVPSASTVSLWRQHTISSTGADRSQPAHTMTVTDGEFRVNSTAANTDGNRRELWAYERSYGDVDVTVRIDRPSSLGDAFKPQPGIALRFDDAGDGAGSALVVDANIWSQTYDRMVVAHWSWPHDSALGVAIEPIGDPLRLDERVGRIRGVLREAGDPAVDRIAIEPSYRADLRFGFRVGDRVDVSTLIDGSYARTDAEVAAVSPEAGLISVENPEADGDSPFTLDSGLVKFHYDHDNGVDPRAFYPRYVRARIVGSTLQAKTWLVEQPEPGWQFSEILPEAVQPAQTGRVGLVTNHLWGADRYLAFGDVTITPVTTP